jgi:hypothetical protein
VSALAELAMADLLLRLRPLGRAIGQAVEARTARSGRVHVAASTEPYVSDDHARALVRELDGLARDDGPLRPQELDRRERTAAAELRTRAAEAGTALPLDALAARAGLGSFETGCVVACAAAEIDSAYGRLYGYIVDDLGRQRPSVELLLALSGAGGAARLALRPALGPSGVLRRHGILAPIGDSPVELRQELTLAPGVLGLLLGSEADRGLLVSDPDEIELPEGQSLPPDLDAPRIARLAAALAEGRLALLGVWGGDELARERVVAETSRAAGLPLRRFDPSAGGDGLAEALRAAASLGALLWIECDALAEGDPARAQTAEAILRRSTVPLCLSGADAWRPPRLVAGRRFAELQLGELGFVARRELWTEALPELDPAAAADLAARFPIGTAQVRAAAALARTEAAVSPNGMSLGALAGAASAKIARPRSYRFASVVAPRRTADDLVLTPELHRQVTEVASFYRTWPSVLDNGKLGRLTAGPGMRVLFAGEAGTGKTLAAEVIAGELGLDLLKINLAKVVSKWLGETEQNLEAGFDEAERSASVLFFDEADALFAKRGEVRHGTDRYSNLEVGYLLQKLEAYPGLVILATNLRENLDEAFTRRFTVILHFPRPTAAERRRIWELALSSESLGHALDLDILAEVDLTGAGIVAVAQTAALLAASEGSDELSMRHVVQATARQFRREGRLLSRTELREHAALL